MSCNILPSLREHLARRPPETPGGLTEASPRKDIHPLPDLPSLFPEAGADSPIPVEDLHPSRDTNRQHRGTGADVHILN